MKLVPGRSIAETWLSAAEHLRDCGGSDYTVLLAVEDPLRVTKEDRAVERLLDAFLKKHGKQPNYTVAETIFPGHAYKRGGVEAVFKTYPEITYPSMKRHPAFRWGTYAYRILHRERNGEVYNPLEQCMKKMRDAKPLPACYELDIPADISTYDDTKDGKPRYGQLPCLSHVSFKLMPEHVLQLTALYRHHFYVERAFGNLLGLARLQAFVAAEVGLKVGPLICHSTLAKLDGWKGGAPWGQRALRALLDECRDAYGPNDSARHGGMLQE